MRPPLQSVNDCVVKFANVNGSGSASANGLFAKAVFRMGIPLSAKNIFPSNIQGLPTWFEVRVNHKGYIGRRGGVDFMVGVNPHSMVRDVAEVVPGGYFLHDSTKPLAPTLKREDLHYVGIPLTDMCIREYRKPRHRQLFKNVIYVGALAALLDMDFQVFKDLINEQFKRKEKLIPANINALEMGYNYAKEHYECPLGVRIQRGPCEARHLTETNPIFIDGNTATALGAIYGGATVAAWYPITPSTSVVEAFEKYANKLRVDPGTGQKKFAVVQAEDELAALGVVIGGSWNGARSFTATSGPGISLMSEFLGLAYFAEIPAVLVDVQRAGPSTGMPTRVQQSDVISCAYASHGDTKHVLLIPSTPAECFEMMAQSLDLADQLQTPIILLSDLDLGMNDWMSPPLDWEKGRGLDRGKVLDGDALDKMQERFGRYLDVDGDGIPYRTYPATHPEKGAFFTRGTSRDEYATYTENGAEYVKNMDRLIAKWETAKKYVPSPKMRKSPWKTEFGMMFYGTSSSSCYEAMDHLAQKNIWVDTLRVRAFPFNEDVQRFLDNHQYIFVVEQNRDAQMRQLLINECDVNPDKLIAILNYDGMPITAHFIQLEILKLECVSDQLHADALDVNALI